MSEDVDISLRPNLNDIQFSIRLLGNMGPIYLEPDEYQAFVRLVAATACSMVWTYSPPTDGWLKLSHAHRYVNVSTSRWKRIWKSIAHLFIVKDGLFTPADRERLFTIKHASAGKNARPAIPASIRSAVMLRDNFRCVYCGSSTGPFDLDHVVPYSRGGAHTDHENLVCSCQPCNQEKAARTPEEWIGGAARA